jgi:preprotein translocase subunit SecG
MEFFIIIVHVLAALGIIGLVLMQHGKGADMGAAFGSGASQTIFGSVGSGNVLTKSTTWLAVVFFATSLGLALIARQRADLGVQDNALIQNADQLQNIIQESTATAPADADVPVAGSDVPAAGTAAQAVATDAAPATENAEAAASNAVEETATQSDAAAENALEPTPQASDNP